MTSPYEDWRETRPALAVVWDIQNYESETERVYHTEISHQFNAHSVPRRYRRQLRQEMIDSKRAIKANCAVFG